MICTLPFFCFAPQKSGSEKNNRCSWFADGGQTMRHERVRTVHTDKKKKIKKKSLQRRTRRMKTRRRTSLGGSQQLRSCPHVCGTDGVYSRLRSQNISYCSQTQRDAFGCGRNRNPAAAAANHRSQKETAIFTQNTGRRPAVMSFDTLLRQYARTAAPVWGGKKIGRQLISAKYTFVFAKGNNCEPRI